MVTFLVILAIVQLLTIACLVGMLFRIIQNEGAIARLSIGFMDLKLRLSEEREKAE